jgi:hypothetical protein
MSETKYYPPIYETWKYLISVRSFDDFWAVYFWMPMEYRVFVSLVLFGFFYCFYVFIKGALIDNEED